MSGPHDASAAVAADRSLRQGDFMEGFVETTVRSMFQQLRAEYQRELHKVLAAASEQGQAAERQGLELTSITTEPSLGLREAGGLGQDCLGPPDMAADKLPGAVASGCGEEEGTKCNNFVAPVPTKGEVCDLASAGSAQQLTELPGAIPGNGSNKTGNMPSGQTQQTHNLRFGAAHNPFKLNSKEEAMVKQFRKDQERAIGAGLSYAQTFRTSSTRSLIMRSFTFSGASATKMWAYRLITQRSFDFAMGLIIIANSISIGMETSITVHGEDLPIGLVACEYVFLCIYLFELMLRFHAVGVRTALTSGWVKFDAVLVIAGVLNLLMIATSSEGNVANEVVGNINMLKLLRLFRLARTVRVFVQFRTLWLLVQGLMHAALPMLWTSLIMFIVTYCFAVIGMEAIYNSEGNSDYRRAADGFRSVGSSMLTLLQFMFLDSIQDLYQPLVYGNPLLMAYFTAFILIGPIALMSIVTAILVESSLRTANEDQEAKKAWDAIKKKEMIPKLHALFTTLDTNEDGEVDLAELSTSNDEVKEQIRRIVSLEEMEEIFHVLDIDKSGAVSIDEFIDGIMRSQADKPSELLVLVQQGRQILQNLQHLNRANGYDSRAVRPVAAP